MLVIEKSWVSDWHIEKVLHGKNIKKDKNNQCQNQSKQEDIE